MEESASPLDVPPHSTSTGALHFVMQCRASATDRSEHVERLPSLSCIMQVLHQRNVAHVDSSPTLHVDATTPELEYAAQEGGLELSNEVLERTMLKLTTADQRYESALMHLMEASNWTHGKGEVEPSASTPAGSSKSGSTSLSDSQQRHRRNALERYEAACTGFGVAPLAAVVRRLTATGARTTRPVSFSVAAALADSSSEDATLAGLSAQPTPIASAAGSPTVLYRVPGITPSPASPAISPDAAVSVTMPYLTQGVVDHPSIYDSTQGASPSFFITPRGASAGHTSSGKTRHLNLSSCDYVGSPDHFIPVLRTLEHLIYITSLDLHQTHLQEMCLSVLLHLIESKLHHLEYLDISSNGDITDAIAPQLLGVIRRSRGTIHTLVLHDTAVSARTLRQVAAWCCLEPLRDDRAVFPREGENGLG